MIIKKPVKKFGTTAHVIVPFVNIGKTVYVVSEESALELEELVTITLLYRKAQTYEQSQMIKNFREFQEKIEARLIRLEKIMFEH